MSPISPAERPTVKRLRAEIERLGINEQSPGWDRHQVFNNEALIQKAREQEDPLAFLADFAKSDGKTADETASPAMAVADLPPPVTDTEEFEKRRMEGEDGTAPIEEAPPEPFDAAPLPPEAAEPLREFQQCTIAAPIGEVPLEQVKEGKYHISRHLEAQLTLDQAINLRRLTLGLDAQGSTLKSGKRITKAADAVRWLFEQIPLD